MGGVASTQDAASAAVDGGVEVVTDLAGSGVGGGSALRKRLRLPPSNLALRFGGAGSKGDDGSRIRAIILSISQAES